MKPGLIIALCVAMVSSSFAADKKAKKKDVPGNALPPTSPMLHVSAPPEDVIQPSNPDGLITTELGGRDLEFFRSLMAGGELQLQLGDLVKSKVKSEQLKSVGEALFAAQEEENRQIARLAGIYGLALSPNAGAGPRKTVEGLEKLTRTDFDRACVENIIHAITDTVHSYEDGVESQMLDIKSFAEQMLPVSRERLRVAENGLPKEAGVAAPLAPLLLHASPIPLRSLAPSQDLPAGPPPGVEDVTVPAYVPLPPPPAPVLISPGSPLKLGTMPKDGPFSSPAPTFFAPPSSSPQKR